MPDRLVLCRCDPAWPAFAVCPDCEMAWLEKKIAARDLLPLDHPARQAYDAVLNLNDQADRARAAADEYMAARRG